MTVCLLPSLAIGSVMMEVGPMLSVMVVAIVFTLLVVEEAVSGKSSDSIVILMQNASQKYF